MFSRLHTLVILLFVISYLLTINPMPNTASAQDDRCDHFFATEPTQNRLSLVNIGSYRDGEFTPPPNQRFDTQNVIMQDYGERYDNASWQYAPTIIANHGRLALSTFCAGYEEWLDRAQAQGDWLVENAQHYDNFVTWQFDFPNPNYNAPAGWVSGLTNGVVSIFLYQLYGITGEERYLETALLGANAFDVPMSNNGLYTQVNGSQSVMFEEVAHPDSISSKILNGHLIGLWGLAYIADMTQDERYQQMVANGIQGSRDLLQQYDMVINNRYALNPDRHTGRDHYAHEFHIEGMIWAYDRTHDPIFLEYAFRWQQQRLAPLSADLYFANGNSLENAEFIMENPDLNHRTYVNGQYDTLILDLREVVTVRSFGYTFEIDTSTFSPDAYQIFVSNNGVDWEEIAQVKDAVEPYGLQYFDDIDTRYIAMSIIHRPENMRLGIVRADTPAYWELPVLVIAKPISEILSRPYNFRVGPEETVLYMDTQSEQMDATLRFDVDVEDGVQFAVSVSHDLAEWEQVMETDQPVIELSYSQMWRYLRITIQSEERFTVEGIHFQ